MSDKPTSRPTRKRKVGKSTKPNPAATSKPKRKKPVAKKEPAKLEYEIVGKIATIKIAEKTIKLKKWGLSKRLQLGARVALLMDQMRPFVPKDMSEDELDPHLVVSILGQLADDIIFIVIESMTDTFATHDAGVDWVDEECGPEDLFALGKLVYEMNLKDAEQMGKLNKGMDSLATSLNSLLSA